MTNRVLAKHTTKDALSEYWRRNFEYSIDEEGTAVVPPEILQNHGESWNFTAVCKPKQGIFFKFRKILAKSNLVKDMKQFAYFIRDNPVAEIITGLYPDESDFKWDPNIDIIWPQLTRDSGLNLFYGGKRHFIVEFQSIYSSEVVFF